MVTIANVVLKGECESSKQNKKRMFNAHPWLGKVKTACFPQRIPPRDFVRQAQPRKRQITNLTRVSEALKSRQSIRKAALYKLPT